MTKESVEQESSENATYDDLSNVDEVIDDALLIFRTVKINPYLLIIFSQL